jgi:nicotinamidase-related amidase
MIEDPQRTAAVLIDLMPRLVERPALGPHDGPAVLARATRLAAAVRAAGGLVVTVRVERPDMAEQPEGSGFAPEAAPREGDLEIVKRTVGAFHNTGLDAELRARGIDTLLLTGIATNFGVESTGRAAQEHDYRVIYVEDAMTGLHEHAHRFAVEYVFPALGTVARSEDLLAELEPRPTTP